MNTCREGGSLWLHRVGCCRWSSNLLFVSCLLFRNQAQWTWTSTIHKLCQGLRCNRPISTSMMLSDLMSPCMPINLLMTCQTKPIPIHHGIGLVYRLAKKSALQRLGISSCLATFQLTPLTRKKCLKIHIHS